MQAVKFFLVAALAICATQCQAGEFPVSADRVDLRLFVENGAAIARNLFKAVNTGLDQSKPNVNIILKELAPEAQVALRKLIDGTRAKINEEEKRITEIFAILTKALDNLKPIKPCSDKVSPAAKKLALATEKAIVLTVKAVQEKYKKEINNIEVGIQKTVEKARKLFDTEVAAVVKCLTPGNKNATNCLNQEFDKIVSGISDVLTDVVLLITTAQETLSQALPEIVEGLLPIIQKVFTEGQALLKTLGDCVGQLK